MKRPNKNSWKVIKKCREEKKNGVLENNPEKNSKRNRILEENSEDLEKPKMEALESEKEEEIIMHRGDTVFDDLLKTLGSCTESFGNALKRRKREEEGRTDLDNDSKKSFVSAEAENDGSGEESPRSSESNSGAEGFGVGGLPENSEDSAMDDEEIADDRRDSRTDGQSTTEASSNSSSFSRHLGYELSGGEVEGLMKRKWTYKWEAPALDLSNFRWKGTGERFEEIDVNSCYGLLPRLYKHWLDIYEVSRGSNFHSSKQRLFFSTCNSYRDILHHNKKPFYLKGQEEDSEIMDAYLMHSLNHVLRTSDLVAKNDANWDNPEGNSEGNKLERDYVRDHGFTRPKILILLPLASIAFRVVKRLIQLTPPKHKQTVEHFDRFTEEFGSGGVEDGENEDEDEDDIQNSKTKKSSKPSDFQALFGGNNNDHFMIGIKYMRKERKMKLYGNFHSSDIIVASPLGLITKIGEAEAEKEKDVDYLSSIEVLIIDHADIILMQNWSHVNTVVEKLNQLPSKQHGTDILRIRPWYLEGQAKFYRQTIILGSHLNPDINAMFNQHCLNYHGKVKLAGEFKGVLPKIILPVTQIYERFDAESISDADDARFDYFCKKVFPKIKDSIQGGTMIFMSSYFEFVRLRNFLKSQEASFCLLGEYTKQSDISRARVWFFQGQRKIMLYTERAHFYHRYKIRAIQNLIIYSLPERKEFYHEIVNMLEGSQNMTCTVLFSHFDQFRLERIVGSTHAKKMAASDKGAFVFC